MRLLALLLVVPFITACDFMSGFVYPTPTPTPDPGPVTYTVTPSVDGNTTATPSTAQPLGEGETVMFSATPASWYTVDSTVGGTCAAGSWGPSGYTTGAITEDCTVSFASLADTAPLGLSALWHLDGTVGDIANGAAIAD